MLAGIVLHDTTRWTIGLFPASKENYCQDNNEKTVMAIRRTLHTQDVQTFLGKRLLIPHMIHEKSQVLCAR